MHLKAPVIGLMIVRNEADILAQSIAHSCLALDLLVVADCESTDGSFEVMEQLVSRHPNLVLAGRLRNENPDSVRPRLWKQLRRLAGWRSWWVIVDADEFIEATITTTLRRISSSPADHVFSRHVNFYYTRSEYHRWMTGLETLADRRRPIAHRRRHYVLSTSMPRAFRNFPWLEWREDDYFPEVAWAARERILFRHYQYRDWDQISRRIQTRRAVPGREKLLRANPHWRVSDPQEAVSADEDPRLKEWIPGVPFQEDAQFPQGQASPWKSAAKYMISVASALRGQPSMPRQADEFVPNLRDLFRRRLNQGSDS